MDNTPANRTILLVEDESIIAMHIISTLQQLGYHTAPPVDTGQAAIAAARKLQPDIILMDILLKGEIDGIETAVIINKESNIPVIYLTANTDDKTFQRAKISTPFGYLLKPFTERELHTTIEIALFKHQTEQELQRYRNHLEELVQKRTAELEATHHALQESEHNYRTIFDRANDPFFILDADSRIHDVNPKVSALTGYDRQELQQLSMDDITASEQTGASGQTKSFLQKALAGKPQVFEWRIRHKDGSQIWLEMNLQNATIDGSKLLLAVGRDIEIRRKSELLMRTAKEEAEKANRLKNEFLANMSHEIRTPMNAVLGMSKIVLGTDLSADQRMYLAMILEAGDKLLDLLNNVLDYSKIEAGQIQLANQPFDLNELLDSIIRSSADQANSKDLTLINSSPHIPYTLIGDSRRVRQIVRTLLDNAIKFTQTGHVKVNAQREGNAGGATAILFTVSDTGIGIAPEKQSVIFDLFTQADGSYTRSHDGAGLGLAVTAKLVQLMNGTIWVESMEGQGSHFKVRLPFQRGSAL